MTLSELFFQVCNQALDRSWAPGGEGLPFCQRCTGLYVGASCAILVGWLPSARPHPLRLRLSLLCLVQMIPFGLHWIPHGPILRTLSGWIFAWGLVECLLLLPRQANLSRFASPRCALASYWIVGVLGPSSLLIAIFQGGSRTSHFLAGLGALGLLALAVLTVWNLFLLVPIFLPRFRAAPRPDSA